MPKKAILRSRLSTRKEGGRRRLSLSPFLVLSFIVALVTGVLYWASDPMYDRALPPELPDLDPEDLPPPTPIPPSVDPAELPPPPVAIPIPEDEAPPEPTPLPFPISAFEEPEAAAREEAKALSGDARVALIEDRIKARVLKRLEAAGLKLGAPILIRTFKQENTLELWLEPDPGEPYQLFETYPIRAWSGRLGPKLAEGDGQAPEGFYDVPTGRLNPASKFHLSFNLGFPNSYERSRSWTGSFLMVHGSDASVGCYAMGDAAIEEIYLIAKASLDASQRSFPVHCFPFHLTDDNLARSADSPWHGFWENLREGYDLFEQDRRPPQVSSSGRGDTATYIFTPLSTILPTTR